MYSVSTVLEEADTSQTRQDVNLIKYYPPPGSFNLATSTTTYTILPVGHSYFVANTIMYRLSNVFLNLIVFLKYL